MAPNGAVRCPAKFCVAALFGSIACLGRVCGDNLMESALANLLLASAATEPLRLRARRNGVAEEIDVTLPVPEDGIWLPVAIAAVAKALNGVPMNADVPPEYANEAYIPATGRLYTWDGLGPLHGLQVARLPPGTIVCLVASNRPFIWPVVPGGSSFTTPRGHLVDGKPIVIEPITDSPRSLMLRNFLTDDECKILIDGVTNLAGIDAFQRSTTGGKRGHGGDMSNEVRTSDNAFDTDSIMSHRLMRRSLSVLGMDWNLQLSDGLQIVRYMPGQRYKEHMDAFGPHSKQLEHDYEAMKDGSDRFATVFIYCSSPEEGGQTVFPKAKRYSKEVYPDTWASREKELRRLAEAKNLSSESEMKFVQTCHSNLAVRPNKGDALLFYSQRSDGKIDDASSHGGCPPLVGEKWSTNIWVWNGPRPGTEHYPSDHVEAIVRNEYSRPVRVAFEKHSGLQTVGTLQRGEYAEMSMQRGSRWYAYDDETKTDGKPTLVSSWAAALDRKHYLIREGSKLEAPKTLEEDVADMLKRASDDSSAVFDKHSSCAPLSPCCPTGDGRINCGEMDKPCDEVAGCRGHWMIANCAATCLSKGLWPSVLKVDADKDEL